MNLPQKTVTSGDGTTIAYEMSGQGPVVVLVSSALADRSDTRKLAQRLSEAFTVINYSGAKALAGALAHAEHRVLPRQHHGSVAMASQPIVEALVDFWK